MRVVAAIVVLNVTLFAVAWAAYEYWPSGSSESPFTCATLDNERDEPIEICVSEESIHVEDCDLLIGRGTVIADPIPHQVVRDGHDRYCLQAIP